MIGGRYRWGIRAWSFTFAVGIAALVVVMAALVPAADSAPSVVERNAVRLVPIARGLSEPVFATQAPGQPTRVYVVEQTGFVKIVDRGRVLARPFLDLRPRIVSGGEQGLLGLAFPPDYARTKRFYVNYTDKSGTTVIARFRANGIQAVASSHTVLLRVDQPYGNHNGGHLTFGPDGKLWIGLGDGGSGGDPENRAQDQTTLLGKLFTLDVRQARPTPRVIGIGLRNPWRYSFDRATGDLWIGDVGQGEIEEISVLRKGTAGLVNFGWDVYEGSRKFEDKAIGPGKLIAPIAEYDHSEGCSVTGGYVSRGAAVPSLRGRYVYGDYCTGTVWSLPALGGTPRREAVTVSSLSSFGESLTGDLYAVSHKGTVFRFAR